MTQHVTFTPELTAARIDQEVLRLRLLETMHFLYPDRTAQFTEAWRVFSALPAEDLQELHQVASFARSLDDLARQWDEMGAGELFQALRFWAYSFNLPYLWTVVSEFRILLMMERAVPDLAQPLRRFGAAVAKAEGTLRALPALRTPATQATGPLGVILPRYFPARQSEAEYRAECQKLIDEYILREHRAHRDMGLARPPVAPAETEHLDWLAVRLVERKSWRRMGIDFNTGHTGIRDAVLKMAERVGVQLGASP